MSRIIVADPPWKFETWSPSGNSIPYRTMTHERLLRLPVGQVAAPDSILLLWSTWPHLLQAAAVGQAWGYTYKTLGFIWIKTRERGALHAGRGYYTQSNSEPCLLFTRGQVRRNWIKDHGVHQIIEETGQGCLPGFGEIIRAQVIGHSSKPEMFYERVEQLVDGPYLELFGRRTRPGWTVLGDAITGTDIANDLEGLLTEKP